MPRKRLKLVRQPPKSRLCGQACVATILGITLERSIELFGTRAGTMWSKVSSVLRSHGVRCKDYLIVCKEGDVLPDRCICKMWWGESSHRTHWVIKDGDRLLCPYYGEFKWGHIPLRNKENAAKKTPRITSYGEIK